MIPLQVLTIEDEMRYIWPGPWNLGKVLFFWVRYYTIAAVVFDVAQIHYFDTIKPSSNTCVWMDAMIRVVGAFSLWGVEIVMQLRIYALYRLSKRVALINALLFMLSVAGFAYILVHNGLIRASVIAPDQALQISGCPVVHTGIEWAQWVPATIFEERRRSIKDWRPTLYSIILSDNLMYFFFIACVLTLNNLMVVGDRIPIPWFSYSPFHAATGIATSRMLIHVRKAILATDMSRGVRRPALQSVTIGSGQWRVAARSSSYFVRGTDRTAESAQLRSRQEPAGPVLPAINDVSLSGEGQAGDVEAVSFTHGSTSLVPSDASRSP
ncbi:unnamed protein product [Peniophora sp. CBMAI 1063]|nr:unnamed protein product [Peniophora sp. CBMAI 1063]